MKKLLVLFVIAAFLAPVTVLADPQWDMYGSARVASVWYSRDKEQTAAGSVGEFLPTDGVNDDTDLRFVQHNNARIGAKVKVSDEVSGRFEYSSTPTLRLLFGTYNFGAGKLTVGQHYRPSFFINSTSIANVHGAGVFDDTNLLAHGTPYNSRDPQIRLTFGSFNIAFLNPNAAGAGSYSRTDIMLPAIDASYDIKTDIVNVKLFAGYSSFDIEQAGATDDTQSVTAYIAGANAQFKLGMAYVKVGGYLSQNANNYGIALPEGANNAAGYTLDAVTEDINDSNGYGAQIVVGAKLSDMVRLELGYGMTTHTVDNAAGNEVKDGSSHVYFQAPLTLTKGVTIIPEVGLLDDGDLETDGAADVKEGTATYYGFKFQINF